MADCLGIWELILKKSLTFLFCLKMTFIELFQINYHILFPTHFHETISSFSNYCHAPEIAID